MAYSSIVKPSVHFNTKLWTGTGSSNALTGVGFQPDWTWIKNRTDAQSHVLQDAVRGVGNTIISNDTDAQSAEGAGDLTAFGSDGFTVGTNGRVNGSGKSIVAWNWKANGAGSANTDGSTNSTVSVNTTAGFSIVKWTGSGSSPSTIGHGLGAVPKMIILKNTSVSVDWQVYHQSLGNGTKINLNQNSAGSSTSNWNNTSPTSSVFSVSGSGSGAPDASGENIIAYCFAEKKGYSKFESYIGNGNADGAFVHTGFKPAFVLIKRSDSGTNSWLLFDNKREGYNPDNNYLYPNLNNAEGTGDLIDIVSNGFKSISNGSGVNSSGAEYIYMAFAEEPLVANSGTDGVPATAR